MSIHHTRMKPSLLFMLPLCGLVATACGGGDTRSSEGREAVGSIAPSTIAELVTVDHVAVYQGVKVTLLNRGEIQKPNAHVIPGRPALVRVHARTKPKVTVPRLEAELHITVKGVDVVVAKDGPRTIGSVDLEEAELSSTFNFELDADQIKTGSTLSVTLTDPTGADRSQVTFPAVTEEGPATLSMNVGELSPTLRVRFLPVRYQADGSDRLPTLDVAAVESYRTALYKMYPVAKVEVSVRSPIDWPVAVEAGGKGWDKLLQAVMRTRGSDSPPDDVYYVGVFNPARSEAEYCKAGCILGVAPASFGVVTAPQATDLRSAMVLGYPSQRANGTLAQELAHAMGRLHAPCGEPNAIDTKFPYDGGTLGVWGYDVLDKKLIDPTSRVFDFMSYCGPVWVSDYTFDAIYERLVSVQRSRSLTSDTTTSLEPANIPLLNTK